MENINKGLTVPKCVLTVRPKIPQMPRNLSAQFVCLSPKVLDFKKERLFLASVVCGTIQAESVPTMSCPILTWVNFGSIQKWATYTTGQSITAPENLIHTCPNLVKFSFSKKAMICAIFLMVWTLLSRCPNCEEDCKNSLWPSQKSETLIMSLQ
jgi:hypothetical protein